VRPDETRTLLFRRVRNQNIDNVRRRYPDAVPLQRGNTSDDSLAPGVEHCRDFPLTASQPAGVHEIDAWQHNLPLTAVPEPVP
jgi:hypothetical protein